MECRGCEAFSWLWDYAIAVQENELNVEENRNKNAGQALSLTRLSKVKRVAENFGQAETPLKCPRCLQSVYTNKRNLYKQYKKYICGNCRALLIFIAFSDHPDGPEYRFADLTSIN